MRIWKTGVLATLGLCALASDTLAEDFSDVISKTLRFQRAASESKLEIDNVDGSIRVEGYDGDEIIVRIDRRIWARNAEKMALAKEEVELDVYERSSGIVLYIDAPYRAPDGSINWQGQKKRG